MAVCIEGHQSVAADYCDVCGAPIGVQSAAAAPQLTLCPACATPSEGRFCENCGHDSALPPPPAYPESGDHAQTGGYPEGNGQPESVGGQSASTTLSGASGQPGRVWVATIAADPAHYARMQAQQGPDLERVEFPQYYPDRRITLQDGDILIGKRSTSQGLHPAIDLSVAPADIAVSRSHALLRLDGEQLTVTDLGSTNGTCLNDSAQPIPAKTPVPLHPGDRVHVGGWTTITLTTE